MDEKLAQGSIMLNKSSNIQSNPPSEILSSNIGSPAKDCINQSGKEEENISQSNEINQKSNDGTNMVHSNDNDDDSNDDNDDFFKNDNDYDEAYDYEGDQDNEYDFDNDHNTESDQDDEYDFYNDDNYDEYGLDDYDDDYFNDYDNNYYSDIDYDSDDYSHLVSSSDQYRPNNSDPWYGKKYRADHKKRHNQRRRRFCTSDKKLNPRTEEGRKVIAKQTLRIIKTGKYTFRTRNNSIQKIDISKQISTCVKHTKTYRPNYYYNKKPRNPTIHKNRKMCKIEVVDESTFGAAKRIIKKEKILNTCVLNFASATKPGGGFRNGRTAQEESLARQSALFESLIKHDEMYKYNKKNANEDGFYNDYMIYSSRVPVFRTDRGERLFSRNELFRTSVITSAAPNLKEITNFNKKRKHYKKIFYERCRKILLLAIERHNNAIVLGAYGCGVFENDPRFVSSVFKRLLCKGKGNDEPLGPYFDKVVFAITRRKSENFQVFFKKFKDYLR